MVMSEIMTDRKRSGFEICIDLINTIQNGEKVPTRIMYSVNISWSVLRHYLKDLIDRGLIIEIDDDSRDRRRIKTYEITDKGTEFHTIFKSLMKVWAYD